MCGSSFEEDPNHFLSCVSRLNEHIIHRHDLIKQTIAKNMEILKIQTQIEPTTLLHDNIMQAENVRPDIAVYNDPTAVLIDVTVINATNPSNIQKYGNKVVSECTKQIANTDFMNEQRTKTITVKQLRAVDDAENRKIVKYATLSCNNKMEFDPVVITTRGTVGYHTFHFTNGIDYTLEAEYNPTWKSHMFNCIAVALARGNAKCVKAGLRLMAKHDATHNKQYAHMFLHNILPATASASLRPAMQLYDDVASTDSEPESD
jgi:hypothetical protein